MERYIRVDWPESQKYQDNDECYFYSSEVVFVPEELYNKESDDNR